MSEPVATLPPAAPSAEVPLASRVFDTGILVLGVGSVLYALVTMGAPELPYKGLELLIVPLIMIIARFPLVLDRADGGIEVGFDSCVLMFLLCTMNPEESLVLWGLGVVATQLTSDKRTVIKLFNIGVGALGGAAAVVVVSKIDAPENSLLEMVAVLIAATVYFSIDFLASAISVALEERAPIREQLLQRGTVIAVSCFVPFDSLGYLAAVVVRNTPDFTLIPFAVPLVTLLIATRSVTHGAENARRLQVLFDAAVRAQTLSDTSKVVDALLEDARRLLRLKNSEVEVRTTPPSPHEIGAQLQDGQHDRWLVAPASTALGRRPPPTSKPWRRWSRSSPTRLLGCG